MSGEYYLREWEYTNAEEAAEFAENYMSASNARHEGATEGKQ